MVGIWMLLVHSYLGWFQHCRSSCTYNSSPGLSSLQNVSQSSLHLMGLPDPSHHQMLPPPPHTSSLLHSQHSPHYTPPVVGSPQAQQRHTPPNNSSNTNSNNSNSSKFPPPLIPVNGTSRYTSPSGIYSSGADVIDLSSPPQSPHRPNVGNGRNSSTTPTNNSDASSPCGRKLIQIGETATSGSHIPYQVGDQCINFIAMPVTFIVCWLLFTEHRCWNALIQIKTFIFGDQHNFQWFFSPVDGAGRAQSV